jgi:hypothetical protein
MLCKTKKVRKTPKSSKKLFIKVKSKIGSIYDQSNDFLGSEKSSNMKKIDFDQN